MGESTDINDSLIEQLLEDSDDELEAEGSQRRNDSDGKNSRDSKSENDGKRRDGDLPKSKGFDRKLNSEKRGEKRKRSSVDREGKNKDGGDSDATNRSKECKRRRPETDKFNFNQKVNVKNYFSKISTFLHHSCLSFTV